MRRATGLFDKIADRENLRLAFYRAARGKRHRSDVIRFSDQLDSQLDEIRAQVLVGNVSVGRRHQFEIFDPKRRMITAPCFAERVLHHAIMNVCEPIFERRLIADTYACRRGRGRNAALQKAKEFCRRWSWALKFDVRKYFDSICHQQLMVLLERAFKEKRLLALFWRIIASHESQPGQGLPIGSLTSQHFANFYLSGFDRFVKEQLQVCGYVRYMDDCLIWGESREGLRNILVCCEQYLGEYLRLKLKAGGLIKPIRHGISFLGCRLFPTHIGLNERSRRRFRRRLYDLHLAWINGWIDEQSYQIHVTALTAFVKSGGIKSWLFRSELIDSLSMVSGQGSYSG
jgi:RNA-directed DNA polymerase